MSRIMLSSPSEIIIEDFALLEPTVEPEPVPRNVIFIIRCNDYSLIFLETKKGLWIE
jgi:hypothetical protein